MQFEVIFENEMMVVVNKPSGLLSIPDRLGKEISVKQILIEKYGKIYTVHRLDKETSGVLVFAKDEISHKHLNLLFENRKTEKYYHALLDGSLQTISGSIDEPIAEHPAGNGKMMIHAKGKQSLTEFTLIENFGIYSWVKFLILTGRTHQVRIHSQHIGHPVVCDSLYGNAKPVFISGFKKKYNLSKKEEEEKPILNRLALHASSLKFNLNDKEYFFEAPLPKDLKALLQQLQKWKK